LVDSVLTESWSYTCAPHVHTRLNQRRRPSAFSVPSDGPVPTLDLQRISLSRLINHTEHDSRLENALECLRTG